LYRLRLTFLAVVLVGLICAPGASAQTAASIAIISGNGQVSCITCSPPRPNLSTGSVMQPLVVRVTDASGIPIANHTVNWSVNSLAGHIRFATTTTDSTGTTSNNFDQVAVLSATFGTGDIQAIISVTSDSASATFFETQSLSNSSNPAINLVEGRMISPAAPPDLPISGVAGTVSSTAVAVRVDDGLGNGVPNVAVRLLQENLSDPGSVSCVTGPGADPGSVLTDSTGTGTCTLLFGAQAGIGTFHVTIGGTATNAFDPAEPGDGTFPPVYLEFFAIPFSSTAPAAGTISVSSGTGQSASPGQTLPNPLVVRVGDSSGATPIFGAGVLWTVSPAGAATFNPANSISNSQGLASTTVTLSNSAAGAVTVQASLTGVSGNISTAFTINAIIAVTVTGVQKLSGDGQAAIVGSNFSQPLAVQVNSSAGAVANFPVTFTVSGPASIGGQTSTTVRTDGTGKAQITLTAGATTGSVTVTASAGGLTAAFSETAVPVGPSLTSASFFNAAGLKSGSLSPCSLVTIIATGLAPGVQGTLVPASLFGALPLTLGPEQVSFNNVRAPILSVTNSGGQESVTVQVPCEVSPGSSVPVTVNAGGGTATVNVAVQIASPGIFETPMSDGVRRGVMVRPDGSFVTLENPARRGEVIRVYVTGLGATAPPIGTGSIPVPGTDSLVLGQVIVGVNNSGARVISARMAPTQIGIYEVTFQVDSNAATGNNLVLSVAINPSDGSATQFSNGSKIPIQ
jgi:uncharacterized protein (TIGR03437 family)